MPSKWMQIADHWSELKPEIRREWSELTDSEIEGIMGQRGMLVGKLQERYGLPIAVANHQVDRWVEKVQV